MGGENTLQHLQFLISFTIAMYVYNYNRHLSLIRTI
jgi:hypothetical protein